MWDPHNEGGSPSNYALSCTVMSHQPELWLNWKRAGEGGRGFVGGGGGVRLFYHPIFAR